MPNTNDGHIAHALDRLADAMERLVAVQATTTPTGPPVDPPADDDGELALADERLAFALTLAIVIHEARDSLTVQSTTDIVLNRQDLLAYLEIYARHVIEHALDPHYLDLFDTYLHDPRVQPDNGAPTNGNN